MSEIIFKTFRTYFQRYVYDRYTNSLATLSEEEYDELKRVENGELPPECSRVIEHFKRYGMFAPSVIERIEHPKSAIIEHYLKTRIAQMTLQVTKQCNLRCEYCAYSGQYGRNRTHSNERMSFETAKKAIDFYIEHTRELSEIILGFYGGEPVLELSMIKECVDYISNKVEGKKIKFTVTTNGTLLSDSTVDFLVENDFLLNISLDGSRIEHDRNRRFQNGSGSFDTIISNIKRAQERHPEFCKSIGVMTTINPHIDLSCVIEYFTTEEIFSDMRIIFNTMAETALRQESSYDEDYYGIRNYEYIKLLFAMVGKLDKKHISPLMDRAWSDISRR